MPVTISKTFQPLSEPVAGDWPQYRLDKSGVVGSFVDWTPDDVVRMTAASGDPALSYQVDLSLSPGGYVISWDDGRGLALVEDFVVSIPQTGDVTTSFSGLETLGTVDDGSPSAGMFTGNSGLSTRDDNYKDQSLCFLSGTLVGLKRRVVGYKGATRRLRIFPAFPAAPSDGDSFSII